MLTGSKVCIPTYIGYATFYLVCLYIFLRVKNCDDNEALRKVRARRKDKREGGEKESKREGH